MKSFRLLSSGGSVSHKLLSFADAKIHNERNDFIKFYEANTHLALDEAVKVFRALENMPVF